MAFLLSFLSLMLVVMASLALPSHPTNTSIPFLRPEPRVKYDSTCRCGQKGATRIVGGQVTGVNEWPWMAGLFYYNNQQFCGGSLINNRYVLTAAHCTIDYSASEITVRLAEHKLSTTSETNVVTRSVSRIINHKYYEPGTEKNDIALLKLSSQVKVGPTVLPVCMPSAAGQPYGGNARATVTGWGTVSWGGSSSNVLREVVVKVWAQKACRKAYSDKITSSMLCASGNGKDSCQGDSGGPLVFKDANNYYNQIGIVSWGHKCAVAGYPGVYTRVNKFLTWIKANTADGVYCKGMTL